MHPHTYARVSCDSFNTSKQLLKAIWIAVITAKFKFDARDSSNKSMKKFELFRTSLGYKVPTTFGDLAALLGPFLDSFLGCQKSFYSTHNIFNDADTDFGMKKAIKSNGVSSAGRQSGSLDPKTFGYSPSSGKMREGVMYLLLDRIDCVERLEKGLTNCLLRISEVCGHSSNLNHRCLLQCCCDFASTTFKSKILTSSIVVFHFTPSCLTLGSR